MSRRIELTVPNEWVPPVRQCLEDADKCNLSDTSERPGMLVEIPGRTKTVFLITVPGAAVANILDTLRKNGITNNVGRVLLTPIDFAKPDLTKPLAKPLLTLDNLKVPEKKGAPLKGLQQFMKARKTTEEMYAEISNGASMTINTWMNLIGASVMAAGGLTTGVLVFIVAAMLVSPIMGPILGMTMGYRVADFNLFKTGFFSEMKMAVCTFVCGCFFGMVLGDVGKTYNWPNDAMMPEGQGFNLVISIIVSAAAGMVLGVSLTSTGGNALVGTAISAGLLPPLVNAGMMFAYAAIYAPKSAKSSFFQTGTYNILFYFTHVVTIIVVANFVFWLKDIDPRFKEGDDSDFQDVPTLVEHKKHLEEIGKQMTEREKAEYFFENVKQDLKKDVQELAANIKDKAATFTNIIMGKPNSNSAASRRTSYRKVDQDEEGEGEGDVELGRVQRSREKGGAEDVHNPLVSSAKPPSRKVEKSVNFNFDEEVGGLEEGEKDLEVVPVASAPVSSKDKVISFYSTYNPSKLSEIDTILERYAGKEDELLAKLHKQYNVKMV